MTCFIRLQDQRQVTYNQCGFVIGITFAITDPAQNRVLARGLADRFRNRLFCITADETVAKVVFIGKRIIYRRIVGGDKPNRGRVSLVHGPADDQQRGGCDVVDRQSGAVRNYADLLPLPGGIADRDKDLEFPVILNAESIQLRPTQLQALPGTRCLAVDGPCEGICRRIRTGIQCDALTFIGDIRSTGGDRSLIKHNGDVFRSFYRRISIVILCRHDDRVIAGLLIEVIRERFASVFILGLVIPVNDPFHDLVVAGIGSG